jgi:hypothetical protein
MKVGIFRELLEASRMKFEEQLQIEYIIFKNSIITGELLSK